MARNSDAGGFVSSAVNIKSGTGLLNFGKLETVHKAKSRAVYISFSKMHRFNVHSKFRLEIISQAQNVMALISCSVLFRKPMDFLCLQRMFPSKPLEFHTGHKSSTLMFNSPWHPTGTSYATIKLAHCTFVRF